jgi:FkbM family methyltransferase
MAPSGSGAASLTAPSPPAGWPMPTKMQSAATTLEIGMSDPPVPRSHNDAVRTLSDQVVDFFYRLLLGRDPDTQGFVAHSRALQEGRISVADLYSSFLASREYQERLAAADDPFRDRSSVSIPYLGCSFEISGLSVVARELQSETGYEPWALPYFLEFCRDGMTVLDIGASWGVYGLPAAKRVGPKGRVFAVEVSPRNCRILLRNARLNALTNFELLAFAASDRVGTALLPVQTHSNTNSVHQIAVETEGNFFGFDIVPTLPLDLVRGQFGRVDLVKMDIDGTEYRACVGARELLRECRPVVFLEYCPQLLRPLSEIEPVELLRIFLDLGYGIEVLHRARPRERIAVEAPGEAIAQIDRICDEHVSREGGTHLDLCMLPVNAPAPGMPP